MTTSESGPPPTHIRTFHPRRGRIGPVRAQSLSELWPAWGFDIGTPEPAETGTEAEAEADATSSTADAAAAADGPRAFDQAELFGQRLGAPARPLVLEIGCGMGEATVERAAADPDRDYLGVDVHTPGLGNLLMLARARGLDNVRAARGDAVELLRDLIKPGSVDTIQVFFPDPWPKARHHKRRIIRPELVSLMRERLRPGGMLHCATDWADYAEQMLQVLSADPGLVNAAAAIASPAGVGADAGAAGVDAPGFTPRPDWRPVTKFERRALEAGREVFDLVFIAR
ncbi:MAG TPA: tRNA (guanosine(46)-N7)-methyltransferase TrmB [Actinocrinis sp.]|nr:tRNA (guanosine(46)-N7)-methyltransferase TrmB [Actinocrinis sp.]